MGAVAILNIALQAVQAGFVLEDIVNIVNEMRDKGANEEYIHKYLRGLANEAQTKLEQA